MKKKIFRWFCIPLMLINNNVYTFISGILLSLSTGIITDLCLDKGDFLTSWHLCCSAIIYTIAGALFIYIATRISSYQNYIASKQIVDRDTQKSILQDFEFQHALFWMFLYLILFITIVSGTGLLFLNYII